MQKLLLLLVIAERHIASSVGTPWHRRQAILLPDPAWPDLHSIGWARHWQVGVSKENPRPNPPSMPLAVEGTDRLALSFSKERARANSSVSYIAAQAVATSATSHSGLVLSLSLERVRAGLSVPCMEAATDHYYKLLRRERKTKKVDEGWKWEGKGQQNQHCKLWLGPACLLYSWLGRAMSTFQVGGAGRCGKFGRAPQTKKGWQLRDCLIVS